MGDGYVECRHEDVDKGAMVAKIIAALEGSGGGGGGGGETGDGGHWLPGGDADDSGKEEEGEPIDFILCIGDDTSDESMFVELQNRADMQSAMRDDGDGDSGGASGSGGGKDAASSSGGGGGGGVAIDGKGKELSRQSTAERGALVANLARLQAAASQRSGAGYGGAFSEYALRQSEKLLQEEASGDRDDVVAADGGGDRDADGKGRVGLRRRRRAGSLRGGNDSSGGGNLGSGGDGGGDSGGSGGNSGSGGVDAPPCAIFTCTVGRKPSAATYYLNSSDEVCDLLESLVK